MGLTTSRPFETVPRTAAGHFTLLFYAAVHAVVDHVRRLASTGGPPVDQVLDRYPFLAGYLRDLQPAQWQAEIAAWEAETEAHLPLRALDEAGIGFAGRLAFLLAGLVEEDSRFGTLFAELQEPVGQRRPTLELTGRVIAAGEARLGETDAWTLCRPLVEAGLLEIPNRQAPRTEWLLRVPPLLWDAARGQAASVSGFQLLAPEELPVLQDLLAPDDFLERLARVPALLADGRARTLVLRSDPGADPVEVAGAVARALDRGLLLVDGSADEERTRAVGPLATLTRSLPALARDLGPGETTEPPALTGYRGPLVLLLGMEGGLGGRGSEGAVTLVLPAPGAELRRRCWLRALEGRPAAGLDEIVGRFHLSAGFIRRVARIAAALAALDGREEVRPNDVREAGRALNRQMLDTLADPLEAWGTWGDLVTSETTTAKLAELERRCRHRERLLDHLGPAFGNGASRGVRALFTGPSGTGKTLAARVLAAELGMDLYRVDLAAVVNKYIGETEKNLHRVLSRAEALDVVLLLDEGDALLGQRTEVKSANDRFANLETNYLLQRLESYRGIVLVTTNLGENIDPAFQRRMDVVVPFLPPRAEERWRILDLHLPRAHGVAPAYLERVARRCALTGGQLRNTALHATLLALDEAGPVELRHLDEALRSEYRKAGGTFPLSEAVAPRAADGGMEVFVAALEGRP